MEPMSIREHLHIQPHRMAAMAFKRHPFAIAHPATYSRRPPVRMIKKHPRGVPLLLVQLLRSWVSSLSEFQTLA